MLDRYVDAAGAVLAQVAERNAELLAPCLARVRRPW
jgi:hypothetical protein